MLVIIVVFGVDVIIELARFTCGVLPRFVVITVVVRLFDFAFLFTFDA